MSKFQILPVHREADSIGGVIQYNHRAIGGTAVMVDDLRVKGRSKTGELSWLTGLKPGDIRYNGRLNSEQKEVAIKQLEADILKLSAVYPEGTLDEQNDEFWGRSAMGKVTLYAGSENLVYDTDRDPKFVILKYGILAGSYDLIAPSLEIAQETSAPFYMSSLEEADQKSFVPVNEKLNAFSELNDFLTTQPEENVLMLAWALDETTRGYTLANGKNTVSAILVDFLEGKLVKGQAKRKCATRVRAILKQWKETPQNVKGAAVFHLANHYGYVNYDKGFFYTNDRRTKLASTIEDSIELLLDPVNRDEMNELATSVKQDLRK